MQSCSQQNDHWIHLPLLSQRAQRIRQVALLLEASVVNARFSQIKEVYSELAHLRLQLRFVTELSHVQIPNYEDKLLRHGLSVDHIIAYTKSQQISLGPTANISFYDARLSLQSELTIEYDRVHAMNEYLVNSSRNYQFMYQCPFHDTDIDCGCEEMHLANTKQLLVDIDVLINDVFVKHYELNKGFESLQAFRFQLEGMSSTAIFTNESEGGTQSTPELVAENESDEENSSQNSHEIETAERQTEEDQSAESSDVEEEVEEIQVAEIQMEDEVEEKVGQKVEESEDSDDDDVDMIPSY